MCDICVINRVKQRLLSRREFFRCGHFAAVRAAVLAHPLWRGLCVLAVCVCAGFTLPATAAEVDSSCVPTADDHLGPYYVADMPITENINRFGKPGEPLEVSGRVRSAAAGYPPIANARVEIWQTDGDGDYHPHDNGGYGDYDDKQLDMRGTVLTDNNGDFSFRTVIPGAEGFFARHKHIHYRITAPGFKELVTQHYVREGGSAPGGACRSAEVRYGGETAVYAAPDIFIRVE